MKNSGKIDVVIPTYNGSNHLPRLLASLENQSYPNIICHVIDDHSIDGTPALVREKFPWVNLIVQADNHGPAHNRNVAIQAGQNTYIVIFDDDTYLEDVKWLEKAVAIMECNPEIGQIATMIVNGFQPEMLLDCGIMKSGYLFGGSLYRKKKDEVLGRHLETRNVLGACSAGTVIRRDVVEQVGGFDGEYFYPAEDLDLSLRIHLAGYRVVYEPSLVVYHFESQAMGKSLARKMFLYRRNCLLALVENFPAVHIAAMLTLAVVRDVIVPISLSFLWVLPAWRRKIPPSSVGDVIQALFFLFRQRGKIYTKRKMVDRFRIKPRSDLLDINKTMCREMS